MGDTPDNLGTDSFTEVSSVHVSNTVDALNRAVHCQKDALENLLSCYSTNEACSNKDFKRLRTWLTNSLFLYKDLHLPQTTQVVANLQTIFMMYEIMDVETFMEDIQKIAEEVKIMAQDANLIAAIHRLLLEDLYLYQNNTRKAIDSLNVEAKFFCAEAINIMKQTDQDEENCNKEAAHKQRTHVVGGTGMAATSTAWLMVKSSAIVAAATGVTPFSAGAVILAGATGLVGLGLGGVVLVATGYKEAAARIKEGKEAASEGRARAFAAEEQEKLMCTASKMVQRLMSASKSFMEAIEKVSGFFKQLEGHLVRCSTSVKSAQQRPSSSTDRQIKLSTNRHLKMMKACSSKVLEACDTYTAYVPAVEAAVQALAHLDKSNSSANYIEVWLKKRRLKLATGAEFFRMKVDKATSAVVYAES